jgi:CubicO group peptidase (beta-lactamase class C family)
MAGAQVVAVPPSERIDAVFAAYNARTTPGCAVAVLHRDSVVFQNAYGMALIGFGVPMTTATTTWIPYSEARIFTALAVAMLARDGAISLDDPVRRHVPGVPAYAGAVTVRQLVHHTSGLADYGSLNPGFDLSDRMSEDEFFRILARWGKLGFPPGRGQMYSNTDYALLRLLVERVTHRSLHDFLSERLLTPLGMRATRIGADQGLATSAHALFHEPIAGGWRTLLRYRVSPVGGISVTTSVDDLARWARALRDPTQGIEPLLASLERGAPESARAEGFAYGIHRSEQSGIRTVAYHGVGDYEYLTRVPDADLSVVTLCNAYGGMSSFGPAVAALFVEPAAGVRAPAAVAPAVAATVAVPIAELRRYVGEYVLMDVRDVGMRFDVPDSALVVTMPNSLPVTARALGDGRFEVVLGAATVLLTFAASDSTPGGMLMTGRDVATGEFAGPPVRRKVPRLASAATLRAYLGTYVGDSVDATLHVTMQGDRAVIAGRGLPPTELQPDTAADTFRFSIYIARFQRNTAGRVTHLTLDASRVASMRYTRRQQQ